TLALPDVGGGQEYFVRVGFVANGVPDDDLFTLSISTPYTPTDLSFDPATGIATDPGVLVGPASGAKLYRLNLAPGTDVLAVEVKPDPGSTIQAQVILVGPHLPATPPHQVDQGGATLFLPLNVSGMFGPIDLYVAGLSGTGSATVRVGQLDIPSLLDVD